ncbi:rhomboid family intramembrane serine protease [Xylella fastidiosa subsp. sandyi]|uniref:rhomboid family intramembrane serine protease n=1 Tax=Xylella fastidiosa TaxID=2371 RepID=UPI001F4EF570|nr:rhomboid family intramembrane serine protease [Xylella fastidiosa]
MITLLTHISNAPLFGNVVGLVLLARRVARVIGITGAVLLGAVAGELANTAAAGLICRPVMIGASAAVFALAGRWLVLFLHDQAADVGITLLLALIAHLFGTVLGAALGVCCGR